MSLTNDQLSEITNAINARLAEFDNNLMPTLPLGIVRVAADVIKRWHEERGEAWAMQRISEVTITHEMALKLSKQGYALGHEAAKREMAPARDEAEDKRNGFHVRDDGSEQTPWRDVADLAEHPIAGAPDEEPRTNPPPKSDEKLTSPPAPLVPRRIQPRTLAEVDQDKDGDEVELVTTRADRSATRLDPEEKAAALRECLGELQLMAVDGVMPSVTTWDADKPAHLPKSGALTKRHDLTWQGLAAYAHLEFAPRPGPKARQEA